MSRLRDPDFEAWLAACFDPPAGDDPFNDWYWPIEAEQVVLSPPVAARHIRQLLEAPGAILEMHHDNQVCSGLKYVFDPGCGGDSMLVGEPSVPHSDQMAIAQTIDRLYSEIFAPRCPQVLGHLSEDGGRLAGLAYMFWDTSHIGVPARPAEAEAFQHALLDALARILALPHAAAQEGALHGLGHWTGALRPMAEAIIDRFLAAGTPARPELIPYARAARSGCVL